MHIVHLIAVEADDEDEATAEAESAIDGYGNGDVWDWYVVGGRWDGHLDGENTCNAAKKPAIFKAALDDVVKAQNLHFKELQDRMTGRRVTAREVPATCLGFPVKDKKGAAQRVSDANAAAKATLDLALGAKDLQTWDYLAKSQGSDGWMLGYYLRKFGTALDGSVYHFDAYFWDALEYTTRVDACRTRSIQSPERQWLVTMDLHN